MTGPIDGVLLDLDGVLIVSWEPLPGAIETVDRLRGAGIPFRVATNTTTHSRRSLSAALRDAGLRVEPHEIITAPVATAAYLRERHPGARCFVLAKGDGVEDLEGIEIVDERADVVVIGGAEENFTYENMNKAFRLILDGAPLVAMLRNRFWMTAEGLSLDAGAYVTALEEATDAKAVVPGKPAAEFFHQAVSLLGVRSERTAMVGDDIANDVLAAQAAGLIGVLVRTGKFREDDLAVAGGAPDHVIDSIADLPDLLAAA